VTSVTPVGASVGDLAQQSITWPVTGAAVRAVS
jgi:hypothetical protein